MPWVVEVRADEHLHQRKPADRNRLPALHKAKGLTHGERSAPSFGGALMRRSEPY